MSSIEVFISFFLPFIKVQRTVEFQSLVKCAFLSDELGSHLRQSNTWASVRVNITYFIIKLIQIKTVTAVDS